MKRGLFGFVVMAAMGGMVLAQERTDAELEGVWDLEAIEIGGKKIDAPKGKGGSFTFTKDGKVLMKDPNKPDKHGKYKADAGTDPKQLDLIESKDGKDGQVMRFIYEV